MKPIIETTRVSKSYVTGGQLIPAVASLTMSVSKGQCLLLEGPSGCGKSTLLNLIGCLTRPTSGQVFLEGKDLSRLPDHFLTSIRRSRIGFVFQAYNLLPRMSVADNVAMPLIPLGVGQSKRNNMAIDLLRRFGMERRADSPVNELSGGEQQRTAVVRALINDPDIILADEPNSNVDKHSSDVLIETFWKLKKEGKTIVVSSHNGAFQQNGLVDDVLSMGRG